MILSNQLIPLYSQQDIRKLTDGTVIGNCKIEAIANFNICNKLIAEHNNNILNARINNDKTF